MFFFFFCLMQHGSDTILGLAGLLCFYNLCRWNAFCVSGFCRFIGCCAPRRAGWVGCRILSGVGSAVFEKKVFSVRALGGVTLLHFNEKGLGPCAFFLNVKSPLFAFTWGGCQPQIYLSLCVIFPFLDHDFMFNQERGSFFFFCRIGEINCCCLCFCVSPFRVAPIRYTHLPIPIFFFFFGVEYRYPKGGLWLLFFLCNVCGFREKGIYISICIYAYFHALSNVCMHMCFCMRVCILVWGGCGLFSLYLQWSFSWPPVVTNKLI